MEFFQRAASLLVNIVQRVTFSLECGSSTSPFNTSNLLSANKTYKNINKKSKLILIYGDKDKISPPKKSKDFYALVKKEQVNVKLIEVKNAVHLNLELREEVMDEILELLE